MWTDFISSISNQCQFQAPATRDAIESVKKKLNIDLPTKLADLYSETNGVYGEYGISFIWSIEQLVKENLFFWTLDKYRDIQPLETYLFFSDAGNGDLFGYRIENGEIQSEEIYL